MALRDLEALRRHRPRHVRGSPPDTGVEPVRPVDDVLVDNVRDSSGTGLRADNYWDNPAFCAPAAAILKQLSA